MKKLTKILKKKLKNYNPKLKEECGVFGISNIEDASALDEVERVLGAVMTTS